MSQEISKHITFREVFLFGKSIWRRLLATFIFGLMLATGAALLPSDKYVASVVLAPNQNTEDGVSGLLNQYGSIAGLAGISLPNTEGLPLDTLRVEVMKSKQFILNFIRQQDIVPELVASSNWVPETRTLEFDLSQYNPETGGGSAKRSNFDQRFQIILS